MEHNVYIKSIHPSVLTYCVDDHGMKVGDVIEKIRTDGPDGIEQDVIELNKTTNSLLTDERPITLTCSGKRYNKEDAMYWAWEKRKEYKKEFRKGTPLVCACEKGRFEDVKVLITGYNDVNGSNGNNNNMTLKEYVSQVGKVSYGGERTPLMVAALKEHFQIVKYLIEQGEADPNIANSRGYNALHYAAGSNETNTELIELLLTHMTLDSINKKNWRGFTPLDYAYWYNDSPLRQEIIALLRSKGGKANYHDENGRDVGKGNGDLNVERHTVVIGSDIEVVREVLTKIDDINEVIYGETVLDLAYRYNDSPIQQEIIDLLRSKGGKANCYDATAVSYTHLTLPTKRIV